MSKKDAAGPEVPFPLLVRYADLLHRLPAVQREHVIDQAKARTKRKGRQSLRDWALAALG